MAGKMDPKRTPLPSLDECQVRQVTYEERVEMWEVARQSFAPGMTEQQHRDALDQAGAESYSQPNRGRGWALVRKDDPSSPIFSYAETFHRDGWAKDKDGMRAAAIYGITSVITPEPYRRRGYCHRLLRTLHYLLASPAEIGPYPSTWAPLPPRPKETFPPADACYLSSTATPGFYESCYIGEGTEREGWVTTDDTTNSQVVLNIESLEPSHAGQTGKVEYDLVYHSDLDELAEEIAKTHLELLENTQVAENETVLRIIPNSPKGALMYTDIHWVVGCDAQRPFVASSPGMPIGLRLRLRPTGESDEPGPLPLVLFLPSGRTKGELLVLLLLHVDETTVLPLLQALKEVGERLDPPCTSIRLWGLDERSPVVGELKKYGADFTYRPRDKYLPIGVAWYGPKGSKARLEGLEAWTWI